MHCREYAAQLRNAYPQITAAGGGVVAIGTGNQTYAAAFVQEMQVPFLVLIDDSGQAAEAASLQKMKPWVLLNPLLWKESFDAFRDGYRQKKPGKRPMQLGAVFVVGQGGDLRYEHLEADPSDHAPIEQVLSAIS